MTDPDVAIILRVPVENRTGEAVTFGKPLCGCTCTESDLAPSAVPPGGTAVLTEAVRPGLRTGRQVFGCSWLDQHGATWSGRVTVEFLPRRKWEPSGVRLDPRGSGGFSGTAVLIEHAPAGALPPPGEFVAVDGQLSVTAGAPTVVTLPGGLARRETPVTVTVTASGLRRAGTVLFRPGATAPSESLILSVWWPAD